MNARDAALLELSSERDQWQRRLLATEREGYDRGRTDGFDEGWIAAEDAAERAHQALAARVLEIADPRGPEARDSVGRRLRAAEAGCRRDADEHWRTRMAELERLSRDRPFVRAAYMVEDPLRRTYEQTMALLLRARQRGAA